MSLLLHEQKGRDRKRRVDTPKGYKQHGHVWAQLQKGLGWEWDGSFLSSHARQGLRKQSSHHVGLCSSTEVLFAVQIASCWSRELTIDIP